LLRFDSNIREHEVLAEPKYRVKRQSKSGVDGKKSNAKDPRAVQEDLVLRIVWTLLLTDSS
jgi:hypothetical protein